LYFIVYTETQLADVHSHHTTAQGSQTQLKMVTEGKLRRYQRKKTKELHYDSVYKISTIADNFPLLKKGILSILKFS
jgi:hypothetical protein